MFSIQANLQLFTASFAPTTFSPNASYKAYKIPLNSQTPKTNQNTLHKTLVIRGVDPGIDSAEFQEALATDSRLSIAFIRRVVSDFGPTSLVRVLPLLLGKSPGAATKPSHPFNWNYTFLVRATTYADTHLASADSPIDAVSTASMPYPRLLAS